MKKRILTAFVLTVCLAAGLSAQKLYVGLGGTGLVPVITNQNNYGLPFEMDYVVTYGGSGNLNLGFDFNRHLGVKLEAGFAKLGQKYEDNFRDTAYTRNVKLNYLQVPLMVKFKTGGGLANFYLMAGPQFDFLLSAKQEYMQNAMPWATPITPEGGQPEPIGKEDIKDRYNSMDIMARFDLGVDIHLSKRLFLNAGLTLAYGLTDINATPWQNPLKTAGYEYAASHNLYGGLNVGLNYTIPVGGK